MSSQPQAVGAVPVDIIAERMLAVGTEYYLQVTGHYSVQYHQDTAGTGTAETVQGLAGAYPHELWPGSRVRQPDWLTLTPAANEKFWVWAPGLPSALQITEAG